MITSGSMIIDHEYSMPEKGMMEILSYPESGGEELLYSLVVNNGLIGNRVLYCSPDQSNDLLDTDEINNLSDIVYKFRSYFIEDIGRAIVAAHNEHDIKIVAIDSLPKYIGLESYNDFEQKGIAQNTNLNACAWRQLLKHINPYVHLNDMLFVILNLRSEKIIKNWDTGYRPINPRQSAQNLDCFIHHRLFIERRKKLDDFMSVDWWVTKKEEKGIPIPIRHRKIDHLSEKFYMAKNYYDIEKYDKEVFFPDGSSIKRSKFANLVGKNNFYQDDSWMFWEKGE